MFWAPRRWTSLGARVAVPLELSTEYLERVKVHLVSLRQRRLKEGVGR